jgi:hypothetical protein
METATRASELLALGLLPDVSMIITDYWMPGDDRVRAAQARQGVGGCSSASRINLYIEFVVVVYDLLYILAYYAQKQVPSMTIVIYTFFKQNFMIPLIAFYASTKKQVPHSSLQNRSLIYAKIHIHLRCFGSRFTLKST